MSELERKDLVDVNGHATHRMVRPKAEASAQTREKIASAKVAVVAGTMSPEYEGVRLHAVTAPATKAPFEGMDPENFHEVSTTVLYEGKKATFPALVRGKALPIDDTRGFLHEIADRYVESLRYESVEEMQSDQIGLGGEEAQEIFDLNAAFAQKAVEVFGWDHSILRHAAYEVEEEASSYQPNVGWIDDGPLGEDPEVAIGDDFTYRGMLVRVSELHANKRTLQATVTSSNDAQFPSGTELFASWSDLDEAAAVHTEDTRNFSSIAEGGFLQAALEAEVDNDGNPMTDSYNFNSFTEAAADQARDELSDFAARHWADVQGMDEAVFARAFFGSRAENGAGFWELGAEDRYRRLDASAQELGNPIVVIDDDGKLGWM